MRPIKFEGANINLSKPKDMTDEQCFGLPAQQYENSDGFPCILTAWVPNKEDLEALNRGECLYLNVVGNAHPPVSLFTMNESGELNI